MKSGLAILTLCGIGSSSLPDTSVQLQKSRVTEWKVSGRKHHFSVRFITGPFRKTRHKTEVSGAKIRIDGKPEWNTNGSRNWYGTDGGLPVQEFYGFQVVVNGRKWLVPQRLWKDCYDPNLRFTKPKTMWATPSPDGRKLAMGMYGSDGAGAYYVIWYLRADGRHSREFRSTEEAWN